MTSMSGTTVHTNAIGKTGKTAIQSDIHTLGGGYTVSEAVYSDAELVQQAADWLTGEIIFENNKDYIKNESAYGVYYTNITEDLVLPDEAENGCDIAWESTLPDVIGTDGKVTRPSYLDAIYNWKDWSIHS